MNDLQLTGIILHKLSSDYTVSQSADLFTSKFIFHINNFLLYCQIIVNSTTNGSLDDARAKRILTQDPYNIQTFSAK